LHALCRGGGRSGGRTPPGTMRSLTRIGKQPLKFSFEVYVCDVRGLPGDIGTISVVWERSGKTSSKSSVVVTSILAGSAERTAMVDEKLTTTATLYRSARRATFDAKPSTLSIIDGGTQAMLCSTDFDLAEFAELNAEVPARSKQVRMSRAVRRGDAQATATDITVQMTIKSHWHQLGDAAPSLREEDDSFAADATESTPSERSLASSALTHEALQALEASQRDGTVAKGAMKRSQSFGRTVKGSNAKESAKLAELSQLAAGAAADARQAESRLATLQFRLRTEIIESVTSTVDSAQALRKADEQAKAYHKQLLFVKDQVERIASDDGGSHNGGGSVSPLESEVLLLRRELAAAKMEVARLSGEKEELDHVARRLNKQLAELAAQNR